MEIYYQNVNRIRTKVTDVYLNTLSCNFDIICFTETNLNDSVFDSEIFDSQFVVFRRDRHTSCIPKRDGGGVLIAVKSTFNIIRQTSWESKIEDLWITIFPSNNSCSKLHLCLCYLPPDISRDNLQVFYDSVVGVMSRCDSDDVFLLIGDFNTPHLTWCAGTNDNVMTSGISSDFKSNCLIDMMDLCNLVQLNSVRNVNNRLLDLVLSTTVKVLVTSTEPISRIDSHHPPLKIVLMENNKLKTVKHSQRLRYNYRKCNYQDIKKDLANVDWSSIMDEPDINVAVDVFYTSVSELIDKHMPLISKSNDKYPSWYTRTLIKCLKEKNKYHSRYKKYQNPKDYDIFALLRTRCKKLIDLAYASFISSIEEGLSDNIKVFWNFVNNKRSSSGMPQTMTLGTESSSDIFGICELFSKYFGLAFELSQPVYNQDVIINDIYYQEHGSFCNNSMGNIELSQEKILKILKELNIHKGPGYDGIPAIFFLKCAEELCEPLTLLFNRSLKSGVFPSVWKTAHIVPLHKSGSKSSCENYRPISILCCVAKVFESALYDYFYSQVKPFISNKQHGFVGGRSTVTNLLEYKDYLCEVFAVGGQVDAVYTDFSKAFDKVNHSLLCKKLAVFGIHGSLLRWVHSYLNNRSQLVALKGFKSSPVIIKSGVPQGSHLGPLFFIIYINDLIGELSSPCLLYADDLKIYRVISEPSDCCKLQSDINTVSEWCQQNFMLLNAKKCFVITLTNKRYKHTYEYRLNEQSLDRKTVAKDLGVLFDSKLTFREHYAYVKSRALQSLGFVTRCTKGFKQPQSFLTVYYSLVRSILEYACVVWSPCYSVHSNSIESVQRRALRILSYKCGYGRSLVGYSERCVKFNVTSLLVRRKRQDLIYLHKIVHGRIDCSYLLNKVGICTRRNLRIPDRTFHLQTYKNNTSFYSPLVRMFRLYNETSMKNSSLDVFDSRSRIFKRVVTRLALS